MGRRFTAASNDNIHVGTTAGLAGFDYRYGTVAVWCHVVTYPGGFAALLATNVGSGDSFYWGFDGVNMGCWDGTATNTMSTGMPAADTTALFGTTKATGSVALRGHVYIPSTNTFAHNDFTGLTRDSAAVTSLTIGAGSSGGGDASDVEMHEAAMWPGVVMSDSEWARLARTRDWGRLGPGFHCRFTDGKEAPVDMTSSLGRYRVKQTSRSGTSRGVKRHPSGGYPPNRRR